MTVPLLSINSIKLQSFAVLKLFIVQVNTVLVITVSYLALFVVGLLLQEKVNEGAISFRWTRSTYSVNVISFFKVVPAGTLPTSTFVTISFDKLHPLSPLPPTLIFSHFGVVVVLSYT